MTGQRSIQLPEDLCAAVERRYGTRFATIEELLTFVLGELSRDDVAKLDQKEQAMIEQRLKDLGYV